MTRKKPTLASWTTVFPWGMSVVPTAARELYGRSSTSTPLRKIAAVFCLHSTRRGHGGVHHHSVKYQAPGPSLGEVLSHVGASRQVRPFVCCWLLAVGVSVRASASADRRESVFRSRIGYFSPAIAISSVPSSINFLIFERAPPFSIGFL